MAGGELCLYTLIRLHVLYYVVNFSPPSQKQKGLHYVYAEAVKQPIICVKLGKVTTSEIASAGFSGTIQRMLVGSRNSVLYVWLCSLISVLPCLLILIEKKVVMGGADNFLLRLMCYQTYYYVNFTM